MASSTKAKGVVLVIEDSPDWMRKLVKMAEKAGYEARRAPTMDKAVALLRSTTFDAVVADLRLKEWETGNIQGLQALNAIPEESRPAAVVVTGHPDADNVRLSFRDFKVVDIIFKYSFDSKVFSEKLDLAVRETRKRRAART
jgi:DNA-binding NtrC family response regulator